MYKVSDDIKTVLKYIIQQEFKFIKQILAEFCQDNRQSDFFTSLQGSQITIKLIYRLWKDDTEGVKQHDFTIGNVKLHIYQIHSILQEQLRMSLKNVWKKFLKGGLAC